jgi:hypothetical protein
MLLLKNSLIKIAIGVALMLGGWKLAEQGDSRISLEDLQAKGDLCKMLRVRLEALGIQYWKLR